ncbi:MAG: FecR/PupR family sigma factor regulator [Pseudomonas sp.]|uniref:FecR/PupR family sigma factor regulator n=1 Tax=unclassified Pseudomonas TaxID=196821 RepID=UPI0007306BED|nr:DUF4880 domain-containing protein [Pseudomonas sp. L5B5]KTC34246.1 hypothetical protein AO265_34450 [Pseudomonas sp. ABAC61]UCZ85357.1 DUF4880 domain-containing protein [Pseudomonas sp. L5B5]
MTDSASEADDYVMMQAAHWCMRLREADCSARERRDFEDWLLDAPGHALEYARMLEVWDLTAELTPTLPSP